MRLILPPPISLALAFGLAVSGCASRPAVEAPAPPVLPDGWSSGVGGGARAEAAWWDSFGDPVLSALVVEALENNRDLRSAAHRVELSAAQFAIAQSGRRPTLDLTGGSSRRRQNFIGFPIPGGGGVLSTTSSSLRVGVNASWEVDLWGRVAAGVMAAEAEYMASEADALGAAQSLAGQVAATWLGLLEARFQRELAERTVASWDLTETTIRNRFEAGVNTALDLRLATADLEGARALLAGSRDVEERTARALEVLLGRYPAAELEGADAYPPDLPVVPAGLPSELLIRRPDLVAGRMRLEAAHQLSRQARKDLFPKLTLTGDFGRSSRELDDLLDGDFSTWGLGLNLLYPLIDNGRMEATIDAQDAVGLAAASELAGLTLVACAEVEGALAARAWLAERVQHLEAALAASTAAEELADDQYGRGLITITTALGSQRRRYQAESLLIAGRRLQFENQVNLHLALGGGFGVAPK
jgi:outer membrane protein, multidrug efflux system